MMAEAADPGPQADALWAAALFAVDPAGLGGVVLRASPGAARDAWTQALRDWLPRDAPWRRIPSHSGDDAWLGGLDLGATLQAGRPVGRPGLLAQAHGGVAVLPMAERLPAGRAAQLAAVLDTGEVAAGREGLARQAVRLGVLALDEGVAEEEAVPAALGDRLAFHVRLEEPTGVQPGAAASPAWTPAEVAQARGRLPQVRCGDETLQALCGAALALGVDSLRAPLLTVRAARAAAALDGSPEVAQPHAALAARLVLAPRATQLPAAAPAQPPPDTDAPAQPPPADEPAPPAPEPPDADAKASGDESPDSAAPGPGLEDQVLAAAQAAIPPGLLASLRLGQAPPGRGAAGRSGAARQGQARGRPIGTRRGLPHAGARLDIVATLRAAIPWQKIRLAPMGAGDLAIKNGAARASSGPRVAVRRQDFHVTRVRQLAQTTTVFVVDASGSAALARLAEAKGAVELLLADCYVRRDRVAVLTFRGAGAELLLPPTRSLARAKRSLAGLPGGGGTPLAAGLAAAGELADAIRRRGETPILVLLTDGRANIARDGTPGRARATEDALAAARQLRVAGLAALLLDTSPQPQEAARALAQAMGASYLPLPHAGAQSLSQAVRAVAAPASR